MDFERVFKVIPITQLKWRRHSTELKHRLANFAQEAIFIKEASTAQEIYFAELENSLSSIDEDFLIERCFEWFIFNYPMTCGQTPLELFKELFLSKLPLPQALLLILWQAAPSAFYEIQAVFPGKGLVVKDIFSEKQYVVREPGTHKDIDLGSIIYVRLLRVGHEYEFSSSAIGVSGKLKENLVQWLKDDFYCWRENQPDRIRKGPEVWERYLRSQAHRLNGKVIDLGLGETDIGFVDSGSSDFTLENLWSVLHSESGDISHNMCLQLDELRSLLKDADEASRVLRELGLDNCGCQDQRDYECFETDVQRYTEVARQVAADLNDMGFVEEDIKAALRLWYGFCLRRRPLLRKPSAWVAAVIYATGRFKGRRHFSQNKLAEKYQVATSSVSNNFRRLCRDADFRRVHILESSYTKYIEPLVEKILYYLHT
ncbi:MAG: hypothetical protein H0Z39_09255 [Peptococcaceae bacterium]|nr:hypothetical protein [Peptococcaceae bacterium]